MRGRRIMRGTQGVFEVQKIGRFFGKKPSGEPVSAGRSSDPGG